MMVVMRDESMLCGVIDTVCRFAESIADFKTSNGMLGVSHTLQDESQGIRSASVKSHLSRFNAVHHRWAGKLVRSAWYYIGITCIVTSRMSGIGFH